MKKSIYIMLLCGVIFTFCKKTKLPEEHPNNDATPVFYTKCSINGTPVALAAGVDNYYMNSSHYRDTKGVYVYKADLCQKSCTNNNCGYSVALLINNTDEFAARNVIAQNNGLKTGEYAFFTVAEQSPLRYMAKFTPVQAASLENKYIWKFGDTMQVNTYEAHVALSANKKYSVSFFSEGKCYTSYYNVFDVGNPLQTAITANQTSSSKRGYTYKFTATPTGKAPYTYLWDFGDNTYEVSAEASPEHTYSKEGYYTVVLKLIDANNDTCVANYMCAAFSKETVSTVGVNICNPNYTAEFSPLPNPKIFPAVTIILTAPDGTVYSSKDVLQPTNSKFEITDIANYKENEKGEPTKKIKVKFNCLVKDSNNQSSAVSGEAVLAISY